MNSEQFFSRLVTKVLYKQLSAAELFALARDGHPDALLALVVKQYPPVAAVVRGTLRPPEPVEDVVLDVFCALWERRETIRPESVEGWLHQTARNRAARFVEKAAADRRHRPNFIRHPHDPHPGVDRLDLVDAIRRAIGELAAADQAVLQAAGAFESDAAAAASLNLNVNTYRTRLSRARARLRPVLERFGLGPLLGLLASAASLFGRLARFGRGVPAGLAVAGLAAVGVFWFAPSAEEKPAPPPLPFAAVAAPAEDRFRAVIVPEMLEHLKGSVLGNAGSVRVLDASRTATRYEVRFACVHRQDEGGRAVFEAAHELRFRLHRPTRAVRVDLFEPNKPPRRLNPSETIVVGPTAVFGLAVGRGATVGWPGLRPATAALQRLGAADDAALTAAIHDVRRAVWGRDATPAEVATITADVREKGWALRSHAEWSTNTAAYLDRFVRPHPPREAARLYAEKLYVPGAFTDDQLHELGRLLAALPADRRDLGPAWDYVAKLAPRSRWADESLDD